jgi:adenylyl-sulfate kinase
MTGLPASGKSTLARGICEKLTAYGKAAEVIDGDVFRATVSHDLGFAEADRLENMHRAAVVAKYLASTGVLPIAALIAPYAKGRELARKFIGSDFVEVYVRCPVDECARRDPKGLYRRARAGLVRGVTGLDGPYEPPSSPEVVVDTIRTPPNDGVRLILTYLQKRGYLQCPRYSE